MQLLFLSWTEIAIIVLVVLLLFGGKKIPELMKGMGQGVKSFKDGMSGNATDDKAKRDGGDKPTASDDKPAANKNTQSEDKASANNGNDPSPRP